MKQPCTIACPRCRGSGRIILRGCFRKTLELLQAQKKPLNGRQLAELAGIKPTAMCNRLRTLEILGLAVGEWNDDCGRERLWKSCLGLAMSEYVEVPVQVARSIAALYCKSQVVILAYDPEFQVTHTTTFGVSAFDKENAAATGDKCTKAIGCDFGKRQVFEDFRSDYDAAFFKEAMDVLTVISRRQGVTAPQLQQIERLLRATGNGHRRA